MNEIPFSRRQIESEVTRDETLINNNPRLGTSQSAYSRPESPHKQHIRSESPDKQHIRAESHDNHQIRVDPAHKQYRETESPHNNDSRVETHHKRHPSPVRPVIEEERSDKSCKVRSQTPILQSNNIYKQGKSHRLKLYSNS